MEFESESQMKEVAKEALYGSFATEAVELVPEFDYGNGRTDLVFLNISNKYWQRRINRLELENAIESEKCLQTFLQLHGRGEVTKEYFYSIGAMKRRQKRNAINWLTENGFVEDYGDSLRTAKSLRRHVTTSIAVELKLQKWRDALDQAYRGRSFAEYKYVVLDSDHVDPARKNIDRFKERNVGLLSIDSEGSVEKHYKPSREQPFSPLTQWSLNETSLSETSLPSASD